MNKTVTEGKKEMSGFDKKLQEVRAEHSKLLINSMKEGKAPWQIPETVETVGMPINNRNGEPYRGLNAIVLATKTIEKGYNDSRWVASKDIEAANSSIMKGEKATFIEVADHFKRDENGKRMYDGDKPILLDTPKVHLVPMFNVEQIKDHETRYPKLHLPKPELKEPDMKKVEDIIKGSSVQISHSLKAGDWPKYDARTDTINMPPKDSFRSTEGYYAEVLHQLAHATGHESRLNRESVKAPIGQKGAPEEELRGEIASFFIRQELGLKLDPSHEQTSAYAGEKYVRDSVMKSQKEGQGEEVYNAVVLPIICNDGNRMKNEVIKMSRELTKVIENDKSNEKTPEQELEKKTEPKVEQETPVKKATEKAKKPVEREGR